MFKIAIDASHGGYDSGAIGNGLMEKDLALAVALELQKILQADNRFDVVMTRTGDYAPAHLENQLGNELAERARIANEFNADIFVSIHFNASGNKNAHGSEVLVNKDSGIAYDFARNLLSILSTKEGMLNRGVRVTGTTFAVIRETKMPAVITENAFIDNKVDITHFSTPEGQKKLAQYHYEALCATFGVQPAESPVDGSTTISSDSTVKTNDLMESKVDSEISSDSTISTVIAPQSPSQQVSESSTIDNPTPVSEPAPTQIERPKPVPIFEVPTPTSKEQALQLIDVALEYLKGENR